MSQYKYAKALLITSTLVSKCYRALCACALTCRAWLPRSRWNLYRCIYLAKGSTSESFVQTLRKYPYLAPSVQQLELRVDRCTPPNRSWHLFPLRMASLPLTQLNSVYMWTTKGYQDVDVGMNAHPTFFMACSRFRSITELSLLNTSFPSFNILIQLVASLSLLRDLNLCIVAVRKPPKNPVRVVVRPTTPRLRRLTYFGALDEKGVALPLVQWLVGTSAARTLNSFKFKSTYSRNNAAALSWVNRLFSEMDPSSLHSVEVGMDDQLSGPLDLTISTRLFRLSVSLITIEHTVSLLSTIRSSAMKTITISVINGTPIFLDYIESPELWETAVQILTSTQFSSLESVTFTVVAVPSYEQLGTAQRGSLLDHLERLLSPLRTMLGQGLNVDVPLRYPDDSDTSTEL